MEILGPAAATADRPDHSLPPAAARRYFRRAGLRAALVPLESTSKLRARRAPVSTSILGFTGNDRPRDRPAADRRACARRRAGVTFWFTTTSRERSG
jgi:hypothetical protein